MHEKYTTRGLVISASAYREADKVISIYTEDFGLVSAVAAGVRRSHSKLRYHAQDFSVRSFSLVKGRDLWRLVGAEEVPGASAIGPAASSESIAAYARVLSLIRRLIRGEEKNQSVFDTLFSLHSVLASPVPPENLPAAEALAVFRILNALGYIRSDALTSPLVNPARMDAALVAAAKPLLPSLISAINSGLAESHL